MAYGSWLLAHGQERGAGLGPRPRKVLMGSAPKFRAYRGFLENAKNAGFGVWVPVVNFGLVTFRCHFVGIRTVFIFMIFGPSRHEHDPQN